MNNQQPKFRQRTEEEIKDRAIKGEWTCKHCDTYNIVYEDVTIPWNVCYCHKCGAEVHVLSHLLNPIPEVPE